MNDLKSRLRALARDAAKDLPHELRPRPSDLGRIKKRRRVLGAGAASLAVFVVAAVVLAGTRWTSEDLVPPVGEPSPPDPEVVVNEATLPAEGAYEYAAVAPDAEELARQWQRFRLSGEPVDLDFETQVMLFVGFGESGSCPYEYGGVEIDTAAKLVWLFDETDPGRACTDDYNPRTLGITIDRRLIPNGIFRVKPPSGAVVSVAAERVDAAPQEDPTFPAPPPDRLSAPFPVHLTLDPEPVTTDGRLVVTIRNEGDASVVAERGVQLDRWTGLGFERDNLPWIRGDGDVVRTVPGEEEHLLTVDVGAHSLAPGWYRVTVDAEVVFRGYGSILIRRAIEVVELART